MPWTNVVSNAVEDSITIAAIAGITYLAVNGSAEPVTVGAIAGLGGYRMKQKRAE